MKHDDFDSQVYIARQLGREYCLDTQGSNHYKKGGVEPFDLMIAKGIAEDFSIGNMVKYAIRFKVTRNLNDLKKVSDYAHLLCGIEIMREGGKSESRIQSTIESQSEVTKDGSN